MACSAHEPSGRLARVASGSPLSTIQIDSAVPPSLPGTGLENPIGLALGVEYQGPFEDVANFVLVNEHIIPAPERCSGDWKSKRRPPQWRTH
jgi:hypothetical protein